MAPAGIPAVLRHAVIADARDLLAIWNHEVVHGTSTLSTQLRTLEEQQAWLAEHTADYPVVVAVVAGEIAGYGALSRFRATPAYRRTCENSVYIEAGHRGRGLGRTIVAWLLDAASERNHHTVLARITGGNDASIRLHEHFGYRVVGVQEQVGWKFGRWYDELIMQRMISTPDRRAAPP